MRIAFRVDASPEIGTGHLMRCLTLANALRSAGAATRFVCRHLTPTMTQMVITQGHDVKMLPAASDAPDASPYGAWLGTTQAADARSVINALADAPRWDWLVVDHYALDEMWEKELRGCAEKLLVIDDLANRRHQCDALLDQNLQSEGGDRYKELAPETGRKFIGPRFALLRPEFRATAPDRHHNGAARINVFFGGVDRRGMTLKALKAISLVNRSGIIADVVAGADNPHLQAIRERCARLPGSTLHVQARDMARLFELADLAVGAGGTTSWERCALGLPTIIVSIADNQHSGCTALTEAGAAVYLGSADDVSVDILANAIRQTLGDVEALRQMSSRGRELVDGRGTDRVALHIFRQSVTLRSARQDDTEQAWKWRNDPTTRQFVHDPSPIELETHRRWWRNSLASGTRDLMIAQCAGIDIGAIRFDYQDACATVSIYLDPALHGIGLGSELLRAATHWMQTHKAGIVGLRAEVLPQNIWSNRCFAAAGYVSRETGVWTKEIGHGA